MNVLKKKILFFIIFNICSLYYSQINIDLHNSDKTAAYENIINQGGKFRNDTIQLKNHLAPLLKSSKPDHHALYYTLLADGYSEFFDNTNKKTESYYRQAIKSAHKSKDKRLLIWVNLSYSRYFYKYRKYKDLIPLLMDATFSIETLPRNEIIFPGKSFQFLGWVLQSIGDEKESIKYLKISNEYFDKNSSDFIANLDNIGNNYFKIGDYNNCEKYYTQAIKLSEKIRDLDRLARAKGNLGILYFTKGDYDQAEDLLIKDLALSELYCNPQNTMFVSIYLAKVYLAKGKRKEAAQMIAKAENIAKSKPYFLSSELEILQLKLKTYSQNSNTNEQLSIMKRLSKIEDSLNKSDGDLAITKANYEIQKIRLNRKLQESNLQISDENSRRNKFIVAIILLLILSGYLFYSFKKKLEKSKSEYRKTVEFFENEKQNYANNLNYSQKNLKSQVAFLKSKNLQIQQLQEKIQYLNTSLSSKIENKHEKLNELLKSHLMTEENWRNFKVEFNNEYPEICAKILEDFPEINDSNLRIVLLQKLEFTNAEVSGLLGITVEAVKKSKQRLRKKLGDKYEELESLQK